jgi:AcrR family transcriptional regulator
MRTSNRTRILDAAVRVINRDGVRGVTFESVSAEAGLTRGGLLYHFPSREALLHGIDLHLVQMWEAQMEAIVGKPTAEATQHERYQAFVRVSALSATRAELMFMLESVNAETGSAPWSEAMTRWAPQAPAPGNATPQALDAFVARLAADGLWIYEAMYGGGMDTDMRQVVIDRIERLLGPA